GPEHDDDEIVTEDQPYAEDASPIAQSPDYVPESDPEADPEEILSTILLMEEMMETMRWTLRRMRMTI
ncbi:hypothetical protein Tco_0665761, partial [Tanacetum coccineum]